MATIEPRLMHLLNVSKTPHLSSAGLPPLQIYTFAKSSGHLLSLPPIEAPEDAPRGDQSSSRVQAVPKLIDLPSFCTFAAEDGSKRQGVWKEHAYTKDGSSLLRESSHPLRVLLGETENGEPSHSLRLLLEDSRELSEEVAFQKRSHALPVKDDFVQLPHPLKKQKSTQQVFQGQQVMPPIINGLHEPPQKPPNAQIFPPISSGSFDDNEVINLNPLKELGGGGAVEERNASSRQGDCDKAAGAKCKRRAAKPRRKWSEEETNHLLLGVSRHGVGKWTSILEDTDFRFNDRTAGDLKDRFRTCCPDELRGTLCKRKTLIDQTDVPTQEPPAVRARSKSGLMSEHILIDEDEPAEAEAQSGMNNDSDTHKQKKSRAHRKKMEDLVELGICGPFKKSHRRERRPFTEQDDKEILEGLDIYGFAWTKIQRDPRFHLSCRQPTDLRDRVRNKCPEMYARIEKGHLQAKEPGRGNSLLEPSVNTTIENSLNVTKPGPLEPHLNRTNSKEDIPKWLPAVHAGGFEPADSLPSSQSLDLNEPSTSTFIGGAGEMDISRLLLDDSQISADV